MVNRDEVIEKIRLFNKAYVAAIEIECKDLDVSEITKHLHSGTGKLGWWMFEIEKGRWYGVDRNFESLKVVFDENYVYINPLMGNYETILEFADLYNGTIYLNGEMVYRG